MRMETPPCAGMQVHAAPPFPPSAPLRSALSHSIGSALSPSSSSNGSNSCVSYSSGA